MATVLVGALLAGCSSGSKAPSATPSSATPSSAGPAAAGAGPSPTTVKIGIFPGNTSSSIWVIADQKGFFAQHGVKADFIDFTTGPALAAAVVSGSVDVAYGASSVSFAVARQSSNLEVLGDFVQYIAYPVVVAKAKATSSADAGFPANVKSLKGLKIGVTALGGIVNKYMDAVLQSAGVSPDSVTYIATGTVTSAILALKNGKVDALVANPPQTIQQAGVDAVEVVNPDMKGNAGPAADNALGELDTTSRSFMQAHAATLNNYCKAMRQAVSWTEDPANLDAASQIVAKQLSIPVPEAQSELKDALPTYSSALPESVWGAQPSWLTGGTTPAYSTTVDASCGQ
ncbi:ABC transporter substrate-binding protein [Acidiferrimicrobium sp. IK]|nr:ABC transporter substrate-binding protein [Acidiferrimicrobium sp. IK]